MKSKNHLLALVYDLIDLNVGHKQKIMQKFVRLISTLLFWM